MRDPRRINKIVRELKRIWKENPQLRLCQLLGNCFVEKDLYYIEDDFLLQGLYNMYGKKGEIKQ